jgi:hypothetical protein
MSEADQRDDAVRDDPVRDDPRSDDGVWRDEEKLPLSELTAAVATSPGDGQSDDQTGNDAGIEAVPDEAPDRDGDPQATSAAGRALRTDFTGPIGPN